MYIDARTLLLLMRFLRKVCIIKESLGIFLYVLLIFNMIFP